MSQPCVASNTDYLKGIISCKLCIDALMINWPLFCVVIICNCFRGTDVWLSWGWGWGVRGGGEGWQPLGSCCLQQMPYTANKVEFHEHSLMDLTWQMCTYLCSFGAPYQTQGDLTCNEFIKSCITEGGFKSSIEHWHLVCPLNPAWELVPKSRSCWTWRLCPPTAFGNPAALCQLPLQFLLGHMGG